MATVAGILVLIAFGALVLSIIALVYPLPKFWLPTRKRAGRVCGLSLVLMFVSAPFLPEPTPPTPEELAAIAAEERRAKIEAAVRQRAEERNQAIAQFRATSECAKYEDDEWGQGKCGRRRAACHNRAVEARNLCVNECGDLWLADSNFDTASCTKPCTETFREERDWCQERYAWIDN